MMTEEVTILKKDMTKQEVESWVNSKNAKKTVDQQSFGTHDMRKINEWIRKAIDDKLNNENDNDSHDDSNNGNNNSNTPNVVINPLMPHEVEITYKNGTDSTSWIVTFDLADKQRLDQTGFTQLLKKIIDGHVIFDQDRKIFWIYNSKRWIALDHDSADLRQFSMQAVDIFIDNVICVNELINYDKQLGIVPAVGYPQQAKDESEQEYKERLRAYKALAMHVKAYNRFINFMQRNTVIKQSFEELKTLLGKSNIKFDNDDYLLNCQNGVVDLKTGELLQHDPKLLLTRIAPVEYHPNAEHKALDKTLKISFQNDQEMIDYLKKQCGYFIVGGNQDEHLFMWFGPSARNGKSTIANAIARMLGAEQKDSSGYAKSVPVETFLGSKFSDDGKAADPNLAALQGVRLAIASEPNRNAVLNSGKIKQITGDRMITARFLHQDPATFRALFKILIMCNFLPKSDGDASIKRRINIVQFDHHIKAGSLEDDPEIDAKLWDEREGLLAWAVEGAVENYKTRQKRIAQKQQLIQKVQSTGKSLEDSQTVIYEDPLLPQPDKVKKAIDSYLFSANSAAQFLHETIVTKAEYWEILHDTVFRDFDDDKYRYYYYEKKTDDYHYTFDSKYFDASNEKLLCLPNAYTLRTNLFKMYRNWAKDEGINRAMTAHSFYEVADRYLVPAKTRKGNVYLGITPTPFPGEKSDNQHRYDYVESGNLKQVIYKLAGRYQFAKSNNDNVNDGAEALEALYNRFDIDKKDASSKVQINKLRDFVELNDSLYFDRLTNTTDSSKIDFKKDFEDLQKHQQKGDNSVVFDEGESDDLSELFND